MHIQVQCDSGTHHDRVHDICASSIVANHLRVEDSLSAYTLKEGCTGQYSFPAIVVPAKVDYLCIKRNVQSCSLFFAKISAIVIAGVAHPSHSHDVVLCLSPTVVVNQFQSESLGSSPPLWRSKLPCETCSSGSF